MKRFFFILFFIFSFCGYIKAEDKLTFRIKEFGMDQFDFSAKDPQYEKHDGNGDRYAIIKVTSNNPKDNLSEYNFNFGNMKHIVVPHDGVLWVYVQKNAKMVSITREGYLPINKYALHTTIESGGNYVMTLTSEDKPVYRQMVQFLITPADSKAVVMIKEEKGISRFELFGTSDKNGEVAKSLEYGTYLYQVIADNYHTSEGKFKLNNEKAVHKEPVSLKLHSSMITLTVGGNSNADIYINGEKKGVKRWSGRLKAAEYKVECKLANHQSSTRTIEVFDDRDSLIILTAPTPIMGKVSVTSSPSEADIMVDGKHINENGDPYGKTPKIIDVLTGSHTITLSKPGYKMTEEHTITVTENQTLELKGVKLSRSTKVCIISDPSEADLYIDNLRQGTTPYTFETTIGEHKITLKKDGYKDFDKKMDLGSRDTIPIVLKAKTEARYCLHWKEFYLEAGLTQKFGYGSCITADLGFHFGRFNMEFGYSYGFAKSPTIYWSDPSTEIVYERTYQPMLNVTGKIGCGFGIGTRVKITPQVGYSFTRLSSQGTSKESGDLGFYNGAYSSSITAGLRLYLAIVPTFGISVTPEYDFGIHKSDGYKILSDLTPKIKSMSEGFNIKFSLVLSFGMYHY